MDDLEEIVDALRRTPRSDLLTVTEVADITRVPRSTLYEWASRRASGEEIGPRVLDLSPRNKRWRRADVLDWLADKER